MNVHVSGTIQSLSLPKSIYPQSHVTSDQIQVESSVTATSELFHEICQLLAVWRTKQTDIESRCATGLNSLQMVLRTQMILRAWSTNQ